MSTNSSDESRFLELTGALKAAREQSERLTSQLCEVLSPADADRVVTACRQHSHIDTLWAQLTASGASSLPRDMNVNGPNSLLASLLETLELIRRTESGIVTLLHRYLDEELRPVLAKTFGPRVTDPNQDASTRFSQVLNNFLLRVLDRAEKDNACARIEGRTARRVTDPFFQAKTLRDVRKWASICIRNDVVDYVRRRRRGVDILHHHIRPLVEAREKHLQQRYHLSYEDVLEVVHQWLEDSDANLRLSAEVFLYRHVDGMTMVQISDQVDRSTSTVHEILRKTLHRLRRSLGTDSDIA